MKKIETHESKWIGNYFGFTGQSYDGCVYDQKYLCPTLRGCMCNGSVPKIIEVLNDKSSIQSDLRTK